MALRNLVLAAKESAWRLFMVRRADPSFVTYQNKILIRDDYTCQYCGFRAEELQEIVNIDGDYRNNRLTNLITACSLCAQCCFLEAIGSSDFGGGSLVYLPEMTQSQLNALCHVLFASFLRGNNHCSQAKNLYRSLRLRAQIIEKQLGEGMSNPALYGRILIDGSYELKESVSAELLECIRVLPQWTRFVCQVARWQSSSIRALSLN